MSLLGRRSHDPERIDAPDVDREALGQALEHVAEVNRWLGGERSLKLRLRPLRGREVRVLDVGTGNGAVLGRLLAWAERGGGRWRAVGVDAHPDAIALARRQRAAGGAPDASRPALVRGDALALPFAPRSFDVALCTLTLHHFDDRGAARLVAEMARVARSVVLVSDLERHLLAYLFARLFALTWWRSNRLTRYDGPLSVLRAFTRGELEGIGRQAGLDEPRVRRHFPFRLTLEGRP